MLRLVILCLILSIPRSFEQQLTTDAVSDAPLVQENQGSTGEAISDSPEFSSYGPLNISGGVHTPTIVGDSTTSAEPTVNLDFVNDNDKYDINNTNETKMFGQVGNETYVKSSKPVLRKCCAFGSTLTESGCEVTHDEVPFEPVVYYSAPRVIGINERESVNETFDFVFGDVCQHGKYRLEPLMEPADEFYLLDNGSLWLPADKTILPGVDEFCMESFIGEEDYVGAIVLPVVCFPPPVEPIANDEDLKWILYPAAMLISVPFLLIILLAYALTPKLHETIQGKCLMCHVVALTFAYVGLAAIQLSRSALPYDICMSIAFAVQFSFIACFAWLNVLCFDVWRRLRTMPSNYPKSKPHQRKIMLLYVLYTTAIPLLIITVSMIMDLTPSIPASFLKPQFGVASCWFLTNDAALPYFYGPIGLMIVANFIFFTLTVINIIKHKKDDNTTITGNKIVKLEETLKKIRRNIRVCFSLFVLMGISWTMEIISWGVGNQGGILKNVWYVSDVINSLQGVFIFVIFMLDGSFRQYVKERFKECWLDSDNLTDDDNNSQPEESTLLPNLHSNNAS